jgi:chromosome segregation ATPase
MNRIAKNEGELTSLREERVESLEENLNTLRICVSDLGREQGLMIKEMEEIPGKINAEAIRIDATAKEVKGVKEMAKYLKTSLQEHGNQIEDLLQLKEQLLVVRDVCESQDERMKKILRTVGDVSENSEVQEKRIDEMVTVIQVSPLPSNLSSLFLTLSPSLPPSLCVLRRQRTRATIASLPRSELSKSSSLNKSQRLRRSCKESKIPSLCCRQEA